MRLNDFLKQYVEGYLFHDLKSMSEIKQKEGASPDDIEKGGLCGYSMVQVTLTGMELLGALLHWEKINLSDEHQSSQHFNNYWDNFLTRYSPKPYAAITRSGPIVRDLVRNALAHSFLTSPGIWVTKGHDRSEHFKWNAAKKQLRIDCIPLYEDFVESYAQLVVPIVKKQECDYNGHHFTADSMQLRLTELLDWHGKKSLRHSSSLGVTSGMSYHGSSLQSQTIVITGSMKPEPGTQSPPWPPRQP